MATHTPRPNIDDLGRQMAGLMQQAPLSDEALSRLSAMRERALAHHSQLQAQAANGSSVVGRGSSAELGLHSGSAESRQARWLLWFLPVLAVFALWLWQHNMQATTADSWSPSLVSLYEGMDDELDMLLDDVPLAAYSDPGFLHYLEATQANSASDAGAAG